MDDLAVRERTRIRRHPRRQSRDRHGLHALLDEALLASVGLSYPQGPVVVPMACARWRERLLLHGSNATGVVRAAAQRAHIAAAVTSVDGLVYAPSSAAPSISYRWAVVFGVPNVLAGDEKLRALRVLSDHVMPGRWNEVGAPSPEDLARTTVLALALTDVSVTVRDGGPADLYVDRADASVAGLPPGLREARPVPAPHVFPGTQVSGSVHACVWRFGAERPE